MSSINFICAVAKSEVFQSSVIMINETKKCLIHDQMLYSLIRFILKSMICLLLHVHAHMYTIVGVQPCI